MVRECCGLHSSVAVYNGNTALVERLLARNKDCLKAQAANGMTALHLAVLSKNSRLAGMLNKKSLRKIADLRGRTPLHLACQECCLDAIARARHPQTTPGTLAINSDLRAILEILSEKRGSQINKGDSNGQTPLYYAVENGVIEVIRVLVAAGADPSILDNKGFSPMNLATGRALLHIEKILQTARPKQSPPP